MLPRDITGFVAQSLTVSIECSILELQETVAELNSMRSLAVIQKLAALCAEHNIDVSPCLTDGELQDKRIFAAKPSDDQFVLECQNLLDRGQEGQNAEFKQTFYLNVRRLENDPSFNPNEAVDSEVIHSSIKTICGFLNSQGGVLLIGVKDDATIYGVENELKYLKNKEKNIDNWELFFWDKLEAAIFDFDYFSAAINGRMVRYQENHIFTVLVKPVTSRICIARKPGGNEEIVYLRVGNRTNKLTIRAIENLILQRCS